MTVVSVESPYKMQYAQNRAAALQIKQCAGSKPLFISPTVFGYHNADGSFGGETPLGKTPRLPSTTLQSRQCVTGWFTPIVDSFTTTLPFVRLDQQGNDDARWNIPLNG